MSGPLLTYYERELEYLRRAGQEFAERFPKSAGRLRLEAAKCDDPHVERLLEGFAFLAARVHLKLDDDFSEISEAILNVIAPHYVRPIPSLTVAEFELDPQQGKQTTRHLLKRGTTLLGRTAAGTVCQFRTTHELALWPVVLQSAQWSTLDRLRPALRPQPGELGAYRLVFKAMPDVTIGALGLDRLRFFLSGAGSLTAAMYETLGNNTARIIIRALEGEGAGFAVELPRAALQPVGFSDDESMLPMPRRSFAGYRLLTEYFAFPEKFHFYELSGLEVLRRSEFARGFELLVVTSSFDVGVWRQTLEAGVDARSFRLGCVPAVNLFDVTADPILLDQRRHEYVVVPDVRRRVELEVYAIDGVSVATSGGGEPQRLEPFYAHRHRTARKEKELYWVSRRRPTPWRSDQASEVLLGFVDVGAQLVTPASDVATLRLSCFNSDLPSLIKSGKMGDFEVEGGGPFSRISALVRPTRVIQPPMGRGLTWRLVSQLSLNRLSIADDGGEALREILRLHDFARTEQTDQQIDGISAVTSRVATTTLRTEHGLAPARGRLVELELDEDRFTGASMFLFASVIERFLGMYASLNSFSQLVLRSAGRRAVVRQWAPRSGWRPLL